MCKTSNETGHERAFWLGSCTLTSCNSITTSFILQNYLVKIRYVKYCQISGVTIGLRNIQSNLGGSNSPVSNTRDRSNSFVGPGNFPIHLMLKYTPGSNSNGSNSRTQSTVRRAIFHVKTLCWLEPNITLHESVTCLI